MVTFPFSSDFADDNEEINFPPNIPEPPVTPEEEEEIDFFLGEDVRRFPRIFVPANPKISNPELARLGVRDNPQIFSDILSMTLIEELEPAWQVDERQWSIEGVMHSGESRTVSKATYKSFYSRGLGIQPETLNVNLHYSPAGWVGTSQSWLIEQWNLILNKMRPLRGKHVFLSIGNTYFGIWIFKSFSHNHQNFFRFPHATQPHTLPQTIKCQLSFQELSENTFVVGLNRPSNFLDNEFT